MSVDLEKKRARQRAYYARHREEIRAKQNAAAAGCRDRKSVANRRHYEQNREKIVAMQKLWRQSNEDLVRERSQRRNALKREATVVPFTAAQLSQRMSMYARCWICGDPRWTDVDHVKPLSKGGPHMLANLRPACRECNNRKSATWPFRSGIIVSLG